jgi:hypothetical protein
VLLALISARPFPGSWNDRSRLSTVEVLVDRHTLVIDESMFLEENIGDKLYIQGHFYSDKSPVPAVLLAGWYALLQGTTGLTAQADPELFPYLMTLASAGITYVAAVWCLYQLGGLSHLRLAARLLLTGSFGLATVALTYAQHVNNHILLLGVAAALLLQLMRLAQTGTSWPRLLGIGLLAGLGYTIDLGTGPVLLVCTLALIAYRCRRLDAVAVCLAAALPWLVLHHTLNYMVGGTFKPANANPEHFRWPGCPFTERDLTGGWHHESIGHFLLYSLSLLFGKRGFFGHNLPLFLALPGLALLLLRRGRNRVEGLPEVAFGCSWAVLTWLAYGLTSTNSSGLCCSIRWFVPLLAPGYFVLALLLRHYPDCWRDLLLLSGWGALLAIIMWSQGPWMQHLVPGFWPIQAAAVLSWGVCRAWLWRPARTAMASIEEKSRAA